MVGMQCPCCTSRKGGQVVVPHAKQVVVPHAKQAGRWWYSMLWVVELHAVQTPRDAGSWRYLARFTAPRRRCSVSWNCDGGGIANISS